MSHYYDKKRSRSEVQQTRLRAVNNKKECSQRIKALERVMKNEPVLEMTARTAITNEKRRINELNRDIEEYDEFLKSGEKTIYSMDL